MKILYGIQTTGNGHISRSREVVRELKKLGHEVQVLFSGSKPEMQSDLTEFEPYQLCQGLTFCTKRGKLKYLQTAIQLNFFKFYQDIKSFDGFDCDLVITDFEPISARIARRQSLPSIGLGHQYAFVHEIPMNGDNPLTRFVIKNFAPVDYPVGLHWHHFNQPILPPIVPDKIKRGHEKIENMILVYLPFERLEEILAMVKPFGRYDFYIYHRLIEAEDSGNIHLRPYSRPGFLADLNDCEGVISNAGFELASEAMALGKKILVKPLAGQMEQTSNALSLATLKLGMVMASLDNGRLAQFLNRPPVKPIKFPNVAKIVANWIESGQWEDVEGLARQTWQQTTVSM
jgi:uncharacterized protein (TIGR00661 family)